MPTRRSPALSSGASARSEKPPPPEISRRQAFRTETLRRSELRAAPYNPRELGPTARDRLTAAIKRYGLVQPVVWNRRTGHVVGGHQRLAILDDLEGGADYALEVAVVNVDDRTEKHLNLALNNPGLTADWDLPKLAELLHGNDVDAVLAGFDKVDLEAILGETEGCADLYAPPAVKDAPSATASATELAAAKAAAAERFKETRRRLREKAHELDDTEFYAILVFENRAERDAFVAEVGGAPDGGRYLNGAAVRDRLKPRPQGTGQGTGSVPPP